MGLKLCRDGASDVLTAVHIDNGDWQGRPPAALTAMTQYYDSECAKACHNHEELVAQFAMVAEQPLQPLAALSALSALSPPSPPLATPSHPSPPRMTPEAPPPRTPHRPSQVAKQPGSSLKNDLLKQLDAADIAVMGSMELSNFEKNVHLGSMAQAVARQSTAHVMIVKNYTATGG